MNRAVLGQTQPGARENVAYLMSTERRRDFEPPDRRDASEVCFKIQLRLFMKTSWTIIAFGAKKWPMHLKLCT